MSNTPAVYDFAAIAQREREIEIERRANRAIIEGVELAVDMALASGGVLKATNACAQCGGSGGMRSRVPGGGVSIVKCEACGGRGVLDVA